MLRIINFFDRKPLKLWKPPRNIVVSEIPYLRELFSKLYIMEVELWGGGGGGGFVWIFSSDSGASKLNHSELGAFGTFALDFLVDER